MGSSGGGAPERWKNFKKLIAIDHVKLKPKHLQHFHALLLRFSQIYKNNWKFSPNTGFERGAAGPSEFSQFIPRFFKKVSNFLGFAVLPCGIKDFGSRILTWTQNNIAQSYDIMSEKIF